MTEQQYRWQRPVRSGCVLAVTLVLAGCIMPTARQSAEPDPWRPLDVPTLVSDEALLSPAPVSPPNDDELSPPLPSATAARLVRPDVLVGAIHVQVPRVARPRVEGVWSHIREDLVDADTALRLRRNGLRVGLGRTEWWDAIQAALDSVPGVRSSEIPAVRLPPGYPLALELDREPHEQTLFYVGEDLVLSGESWPESRNVLRLSYSLERLRSTRVRVAVVPEVRQAQRGWKWLHTDAGLARLPDFGGRSFAAAAVTADLGDGDFLVIAPSEDAELYGLVGGAFLTRQEDGERFDSYVFIRAGVNHDARRY